MDATKLLEIIIGLTFVVLLLSIIVTLINEIIVSNLRIRSWLLKKTIKRMLGDVTLTEELGDNFYNHPLIKKLTNSKKINPSYISSSTFTKVMIDILHHYGEKTSTIQETIDHLPEDSETKRALLTLFNDANKDTEKFKINIGEWFNESMDRLSGQFKRYVQIQLFVIGFILAIILNINIIHISKELSDNKEMRLNIAENTRNYIIEKEAGVIKEREKTQNLIANHVAGEEIPTKGRSIAQADLLINRYQTEINSYEENIEEIKSHINPLSGLMGIFWEGTIKNPFDLYKKIKNDFHISWLMGWLIAALGASLGAAFWFDLLKKLVNVRGSVKNN